ncbi:MAG: flavodoxin family protein [Oscillospiraceae bacterium]|nr:flavodoxin family protein [Oscillospiraceae bacterium]
MKITMINGSARKGNTFALVNAFVEGAKEKNTIEVIEPDKLSIAACKGCGACQCFKGCVDNDDTNQTVNKVADADMIVFATPVYWWGMTGQMKLLIDKCYCKGTMLKGKKIGIILTGGASVDSLQYDLIKTQFECMAKYLSWEIVFFQKYSANGKDELSQNSAVMDEMTEVGRRI